MVRVAEGIGYWLQPGVAARQLSVGDALLVSSRSNGVLRASQLGPLKLQFFGVQPQYLNGLLTVAEWHQLEVAPDNLTSQFSIFTAGEPLAQRFTRLAEQTQREGLPVRCGLLQLWAAAIVALLPPPTKESATGGKLHERFRQLVGQMPEAELSQCSLRDLAAQLNCSERHFSRLFREEFGVPFRARQIELRLLHARQLLTNSNDKIINVAYDSGYRHLGLFNAMFKKRFGVTPSEWRQQNQPKPGPPSTRNGLAKFTPRAAVLLILFALNLVSPAVAQTSSKSNSRFLPPPMTFLRSPALGLFLFLCCCGLVAISGVSAAEPVASGNVPVSSRSAAAPGAIAGNAAPRFNVRAYEIKGNALLPTNTVAGILSRHTGPDVSLAEMVQVVSELQLEYHNRGHPPMSFSIAPQEITNGVVVINVFQSASPQILVGGERYAAAAESPPVGANPAAAEPALPQPSPAASTAVTHVVPLATSPPLVPVGPDAMARARAALLDKLTELKTRDNDTRVHVVATNAGPRFDVERYLIMGNTILSPEAIGGAITNVDGAFGPHTSFEGIRTAMVELQKAYRERGFVTVSVGLPQQKLTNATVKVQVTEGRLAAINVTGNRYYSSNNVMRALPSLHTNELLNSHVLQHELDNANASRDRQIYPVIGPGPEPDTSELTLKVKDQLPLHSRLELNNSGTPGTPDLRANYNAQYDNLWDLEHQVGLQYSFSPEQLKQSDDYVTTPFDDPLVANYSAYYRLPLGGYNSVQDQINASPGAFGYNEATHKFNLPPPTGRPELTFYATRSLSDTGAQFGPKAYLSESTATNASGEIFHPLSITTNSAGENITLNEDLGMKLVLPLPPVGNALANFSIGFDYKRFQQNSYNTNENLFEVQYYDNNNLVTLDTPVPQPEPSRYEAVDYFPLNAGLSGSIPDQLGTTYFNLNANVNVFPVLSEESVQVTTTNITSTSTNTVTTTRINHDHSFSSIAYTTNARPHYVTLQMGADRVQTIYKDWTVKLHADGQWADGPLISNEQYAMGGTAGVRGYQDGQAYGDAGWRFSLEPQTPLVNVGMIGNEGHAAPCWVRASTFLDYGRIYLLGPPPAGGDSRESFCGVGWAVTANIGSHLDARITMAWPLIGHAGESDGMRIYFGMGAQF